MAVNVRQDDEDDEVEGNMTPMIDIIFLLLIFFILTTKFIPEEKVISNLLPTNKGTANSSAPIDETPQVNIKIYPGQFANDVYRSAQPSKFDADWKSNRSVDSAAYQVGGAPAFLIASHNFDSRGDDDLSVALKQVHDNLHSALMAAENGSPAGDRSEAPPVVLHGFSGLPWKYVLAAYDAVRDFENRVSGRTGVVTTQDLLNAREVTFAPPRVRGYREWEMGYELFEIIHMQ